MDLSKGAPQEDGASNRGVRMDLVDPWAMLKLGELMYEGLETHEAGGWRKVAPNVHWNHAMTHLLAMRDGDSEYHAIRAFARCMMLLATVRLREVPHGETKCG